MSQLKWLQPSTLLGGRGDLVLVAQAKSKWYIFVCGVREKGSNQHGGIVVIYRDTTVLIQSPMCPKWVYLFVGDPKDGWFSFWLPFETTAQDTPNGRMVLGLPISAP